MSIRVSAPDKGGCQAISLDGRSYPVKNGYAEVSGRHADELKLVSNYLPSSFASLSSTNLEEDYCPNCRKKGLSLFGGTCKGCGASKIPYDPKSCPLRYA